MHYFILVLEQNTGWMLFHLQLVALFLSCDDKLFVILNGQQ